MARDSNLVIWLSGGFGYVFTSQGNGQPCSIMARGVAKPERARIRVHFSSLVLCPVSDLASDEF